MPRVDGAGRRLDPARPPRLPPTRSSPHLAKAAARRGRRLPARRGQVHPGGAGRPRTRRRRRAADDRRARPTSRSTTSSTGSRPPSPDLPDRPAARHGLRRPTPALDRHPNGGHATAVADLSGPRRRHRHRGEVGARQGRRALAARHRRRGLPDALRRAAADRRPLRAGAVRRRPGPARPVQRRGRRALGRAELGPDRPARSSILLAHNPGLPRAPPAGVLAAARLGGARWCPARSTRSAASAAATEHGDRRLAFGVRARRRRASTASGRGRGVRLGAARTAGPAHPAHRRGGRTGRRRGRTAAAGPRAATRTPSAAPTPAADRRPDRGRHRPPRPGGRRARARWPAPASRRAPGGVAVDTANRLQGREFDVTVVLHPLSGRRDATAFHLETGRLCVLASRHRHACVVVCRAGVTDLLDDHPSAEPVHLGVTVKFPDGWEANHAVLAHLAEHRTVWRP